MSAQQTYYSLTGGLDQESAAIAVPPGRAISVLNHEAVSRGYQRTQGYERYSGRVRPSDSTYWLITYVSGTIAFAVGQTVTGLSSGATARVLAVPALDSGTHGAGTAAGTLVIHLLTGEFSPAEALRVGGVTHAVIDVLATQGAGTEDAANIGYLAAAQAYHRALITAVPGSGPVRGVLWYQAKLHAWRDNALGTACVLHQSSTAGWVAVNLGRNVSFTSGGTYVIVAGNVVTGATSGATATVRTVAFDSGDWALGTAAGTLILDNVVGTFVAENLNVGANPNVATIAAAPAAVTFPPGGRYEFDIFNFYGTVGSERAYGANGVGKAFEYDGASVIPISTGMPIDTPHLVHAHKNHLFLAFPKGSLQHSALGEPRSFSAILGAAELGLGHEITNIMPNATGSLLITTNSSLAVLTGNDSSDWVLEGLSDEAGGKRFTAQRIGHIIYLDERGVRSVEATQQYGNFKLGTYTTLVQRELDAKRRRGAIPVGSMIIKAKDQYLLLFSDGTGMTIYFGRKQPEPMLFTYPFILSSCHVAEVEGFERAFVGANDGFVYELNVGTSFDGAEIEAFIQLPFGHQGAPRALKRYHKAVLELLAGTNSQIAVVAQFDYGVGLQLYPHEESILSQGGGGFWGLANWGEFNWDNPAVVQAEYYLQGLGANMSLTIFSKSSVMESYILQGITMMFSVRGTKR